MAKPSHVRLETAPVPRRLEGVLPGDALELLADLHLAFEPRRQELLARRRHRQSRFDAGEDPTFLAETRELRNAAWRVAPMPADLVDRRVEITGPTDAKMVINALNSGANVFMADFEDANVPTWTNLLQGQANLARAVRGTLTHRGPDGKEYELNPRRATLVVRPRGWHLDEPHVRVAGQSLSGSLFDLALYAYHNAGRLAARGSAVYAYLPKMESHLEARLWNDVMSWLEQRLHLAKDSMRATVLIETLPAAFEMEEILWELRRRSPALNAGRWDYLFSSLKTLRARPGFVVGDRRDLGMETPFLRAYARLLVETCHKRGAYAIGGMAAYIPDKRDADRNAMAMEAVRRDKQREAADGFDGTWVAHPGLVPLAREVLTAAFAGRPNQLGVRHPERPSARQLLDIPQGVPTEQGLRTNLRVGAAYLAHWLKGQGAVAIDSLMEDTATAEISRMQVWQWLHHGARLADGHKVRSELVRRLLDEEAARLRADGLDDAQLGPACDLVWDLVTSETPADFLTTAGASRLAPLETQA